MSGKWTEGPWGLLKGWKTLFIEAGGDIAICDIDTTLNPDGEANAHLIAAAPELYEALEELTKIIEAAGLLNLSDGVQLGQTSWYVKASDRHSVAVNALARARGES